MVNMLVVSELYMGLSPMLVWYKATIENSLLFYSILHVYSRGCSLLVIQPEKVFRKVTDDFGRELIISSQTFCGLVTLSGYVIVIRLLIQ